MLVSIAGPLSNLLLAVVFFVVWKILVYSVGMDGALLAPRVMALAMFFNVILAVFNMIPVPPLDGSRVLAWLLPSGLREPYIALERWGMLIIFALLLTRGLRVILTTTVNPIIDFLNTLTGGAW